MHFWSIFKAATRYHRCTYVQVSILQKIWLVITYYRTWQELPSPVPWWGKIPSHPAVGKCNTETNYGWNWKVTGLFCLNNRLAEGLSAEVDTLPKCSYCMISFDTWTGERWTTSFFASPFPSFSPFCFLSIQGKQDSTTCGCWRLKKNYNFVYMPILKLKRFNWCLDICKSILNYGHTIQYHQK